MRVIKLTIQPVNTDSTTMFVSEGSARNIMRDKTQGLRHEVFKGNKQNVMTCFNQDNEKVLTITTELA